MQPPHPHTHTSSQRPDNLTLAYPSRQHFFSPLVSRRQLSYLRSVCEHLKQLRQSKGWLTYVPKHTHSHILHTCIIMYKKATLANTDTWTYSRNGKRSMHIWPDGRRRMLCLHASGPWKDSLWTPTKGGWMGRRRGKGLDYLWLKLYEFCRSTTQYLSSCQQWAYQQVVDVFNNVVCLAEA